MVIYSERRYLRKKGKGMDVGTNEEYISSSMPELTGV
jgi:hypothetical protein